jgi:hypothetical protein
VINKNFQIDLTITFKAAHTVAALPSGRQSPAPPSATPTAAAATAPGVGNYDHLYLGPAGGASATAPAATAALSLKARRPVNPPSVAVAVQQYSGGGAAVLPEIHVPEAHEIHVPAPVAPAFPVRRLPASVYVPEQQQQTDFELFNALNPHRARKPALGKTQYEG